MIHRMLRQWWLYVSAGAIGLALRNDTTEMIEWMALWTGGVALIETVDWAWRRFDDHHDAARLRRSNLP